MIVFRKPNNPTIKYYDILDRFSILMQTLMNVSLNASNAFHSLYTQSAKEWEKFYMVVI